MVSWILERVALPALLLPTRSRFMRAYREMLRLERLPLEEQQSLQQERLNKLVRHGYDHVPLIRERMDDAGIGPDDIRSQSDFARLPVTTKQDVERNFPDRVTAQEANRDDWQYVSTRGTANRLVVIHDFAKREMVRAALLRSLYLSGGYRVGQRLAEIPPDVCNVTCGDEGEVDDGVLPHLARMFRQGKLRDSRAVSDLRGRIDRNWVMRRTTYPPFGAHGSSLPDDELATYVARLRRDRPAVLKALPTYLYEIALYLRRQGEPPIRVGAVKPMGSSVSPRMREVIAGAFTGPYREDYGSAELGDMACDCPQGDGLHVFMDLFLIEVCRQGRPVPEGELGKILVTDLTNRAMPLLRYEIGDVGRLSSERCTCGRSAPRLIVEGRVEDTIVTRDGTIVTNDRLMDFFYARAEVDEFQLIETAPGSFDLTVVSPDAGRPADHSCLVRDLVALLGGNVEVRVFPAATIRPAPSGKFRFVQSSSYERLDRDFPVAGASRSTESQRV